MRANFGKCWTKKMKCVQILENAGQEMTLQQQKPVWIASTSMLPIRTIAHTANVVISRIRQC